MWCLCKRIRFVSWRVCTITKGWCPQKERNRPRCYFTRFGYGQCPSTRWKWFHEFDGTNYEAKENWNYWQIKRRNQQSRQQIHWSRYCRISSRSLVYWLSPYVRYWMLHFPQQSTLINFGTNRCLSHQQRNVYHQRNWLSFTTWYSSRSSW